MPKGTIGCSRLRQSGHKPQFVYIFPSLEYIGKTMPDTISQMEARDKTGWSTGTKVLVGILAIVVLVAIVAVFTLTIAVLDTKAGTQFPFVTSYRVSLPDGEPVMIGNSRISTMSYNNEMVADVDGTKEKLVIGQERVISPRHAQITVLGVPLIDTDFQITLTYRGTSGKNTLFDMTVRTSTQIPEMVLRRLIPANMNAQPL